MRNLDSIASNGKVVFGVRVVWLRAATFRKVFWMLSVRSVAGQPMGTW